MCQNSECTNNCQISIPHFWVSTLPPNNELCPNSIYFVKNTNNVIQMYVTSSQGLPSLIGGTDITNSITSKDLPEDFFISNTYDLSNSGNELTYLTDTYRKFSIRNYLPLNAYRTNHVIIVDKNTIFVQGQLSASTEATGNMFALTLKNCKIINNNLIVGSVEFIQMPFINRNVSNIPYALLGSALNRGFVFMMTRTSVTSNSSQVIKLNPYDLSDITLKDVAVTGAINNIVAYKNNIYALITRGLNLPVLFIKFDENINNLETVFTHTNSVLKDQIGTAYPFTIYNDEVYIPTRWQETAGANKIGVVVYDLFTGNLKSVWNITYISIYKRHLDKFH